MKCIKCKTNEAEIIATLSINGKIKKVPVCHICGESIGLTKSNIKKAKITEYINSLLEDIYPEKLKKVYCRFCNTSYREVLTTNKMGCPFCYIYFSKNINITIGKTYNIEGPKLTIEDINNNLNKKNIEELYIRAKIYLDYGDIEMLKKITSEIKKYDNC